MACLLLLEKVCWYLLLNKIISTMMEKDAIAVLHAAALSDTTVKRRSDEMGANIEEQLSEVSQKTSFSL